VPKLYKKDLFKRMSDTDQNNPYESPTSMLFDIEERLNKIEYSVFLSITGIEPLSDFIKDLQYCYKEVLLVGETVNILVDATVDSAILPEKYVKDGKIVLDISPGAINNFIWFENAMAFEARFKGKKTTIRIPFESFLFIYSGDKNYGFDVQQLNN
jgi:stringent starvation protein B